MEAADSGRRVPKILRRSKFRAFTTYLMRYRTFIGVGAVVTLILLTVAFTSDAAPVNSACTGFSLVFNASHFTIMNDCRVDERRLKSATLRMSSSMVNVSARVSDIGLVVGKHGVSKITSFVPVNAEYNITLEDENSEIMFTDSLTVDTFPDDETYTRLYCMGESVLLRWCYARNVCLEKRHLKVILPYEASFGTEIVVATGARPPPYDPEDSRIRGVDIRIEKYPPHQFVDRTLVIAGRYHNSRMLWHAVMDHLVPLFWTLTTYISGIFDADWGHEENDKYGLVIDRKTDIVCYDSLGFIGLYYAKVLSDFPVQHGFMNVPRCYRNAIIGMRKSEKTIGTEKRRGIMIKYQFDPRGVRGLRKVMIEAANETEDTCMPSEDAPVILAVSRRNAVEGRRGILNNDAVIDAMKEMCPRCQVRHTDFQQFDKLGQIGHTCGASAIVGLHGSGLTHVLWMRQSSPPHPTGLIEFFPYKYTCRDWYGAEARSVGVEYYPIHTLTVDQSRWNSGLSPERVERCHAAPDGCMRGGCHDVLRDQSLIVDIDQFKNITGDFFARLQNSV